MRSLLLAGVAVLALAASAFAGEKQHQPQPKPHNPGPQPHQPVPQPNKPNPNVNTGIGVGVGIGVSNADARARARADARAVSISQGGAGGAGGAGGQGGAGGVGQGGAGGRATATGGRATAAGGRASANNALTVNNNIPSTFTSNSVQRVRNSGSVRTTASVFAPQLVASSVGTCAGSVSSGVGWTGAGLSFGFTVPDVACDIRMASEALLKAGLRDAAVIVLCREPHSFAALQAQGYACPIAPAGYQIVQPAPTGYPEPVYPVYKGRRVVRASN